MRGFLPIRLISILFFAGGLLGFFFSIFSKPISNWAYVCFGGFCAVGLIIWVITKMIDKTKWYLL